MLKFPKLCFDLVSKGPKIMPMNQTAKHALEDEEEVIKYFFSEKGNILVVSISGEISYRSVLTMDMISQKVQLSQAAFVIISLEGVGRFDNKGVKYLIQLQAFARDRRGCLRVCISELAAKRRLIEEGAVRVSEHVPTLKDAIISIIKSKKKM